MSVDLHAKITVAEAKQWLTNVYSAWVSDFDILDQAAADTLTEQMFSLRPKDFKCPRKPRVSKKAVSGEERSSKEYDDKYCDARVWVKGGFGAQCTRKKADGCGCLCKGHLKENDEQGGIKNGLITGERPTHHYGDAEKHPKAIGWHDVEKKKKPAKESSEEDSSDKKVRKCGFCRCEGHTAPKCPKKKAALLEEEGGPEESNVSLQEQIDALMKKQELLKKAEEDEEHDLSPGSQVAAGTGLTETEEVTTAGEDQVEEVELEEEEEEKKEEKEVELEEDETEVSTKECDAESLKRLAKAATEPEPEPEPEPEDEEEGSDGEESDEDDGFTKVELDGITYLYDEEEIMYNDKLDEVGEWNGTEIVFTKRGRQKHNTKKTLAMAHGEEGGE
jgi:hypothetical protein